MLRAWSLVIESKLLRRDLTSNASAPGTVVSCQTGRGEKIAF